MVKFHIKKLDGNPATISDVLALTTPPHPDPPHLWAINHTTGPLRITVKVHLKLNLPSPTPAHASVHPWEQKMSHAAKSHWLPFKYSEAAHSPPHFFWFPPKEKPNTSSTGRRTWCRQWLNSYLRMGSDFTLLLIVSHFGLFSWMLICEVSPLCFVWQWLHQRFTLLKVLVRHSSGH